MSSFRDAPHPRASDVLTRLDNLQALKHALESALDWLPVSFVLVDRADRLVKTNRPRKTGFNEAMA
ncbi:MAG: hypothetical protein AUH72_06455 [Acidobacteria bacterium 13_1_40CM_4_65_8]|nr:MAG: hypothetical protein AUH72_06455 [Acidobacteria bacterium 13_1_40CM_4_65_8]